MKISTIITLAALIAAASIVKGYLFNTVFGSVTGNKAATTSCVAVLSNTTTEEQGVTSLIGRVKNSCDRSFGSVTIVFKLDRLPEPSDESDDAPDLPVAEAYAYVSDLKAGETREFKSALPVSKNSGFRLDAINTF
jgi:hypothetical protein